MTKLEPMAGDNLYDTLAEAVRLAPATFEFNDWAFATKAGETMGDALARFEGEHGFRPQTRQEVAEQAGRDLEKMRTEQAAAIKQAAAPTEAQMRDAKAPRPDSIEELAAYVRGLVDRPHDYGTCVYAMSLAATAAFNFVAGKLGVTGFQASCADMDILRRTRGWEWGRILDYSNLLYPQYLNDEKFPTWQSLLVSQREELAKRAKALLDEKQDMVHKDVLAHWRRLAK